MNDDVLNDVVNYDFEKNEHKLRENNLYLSDYQVEVLARYDIFPSNYVDMNSLLFAIETVLASSTDDFDELSMVADQIAEFNYYHFTLK